ncbi:hypothetical protein D3C78_1213210 [compost metagenome]
MINPAFGREQQGAVLIVGLIMLLLLTLMVGSAFSLSGSNLKSVGNMQMRNEALAAANVAIERKISADLTVRPTAEELDIDINGDGAIDYTVNVVPTCISSSSASYAVSTGLSGEETKDYGGQGAPETVTGYNVILDFRSVVTDAASGASVAVRAGVRVLLTREQQEAVCI